MALAFNNTATNINSDLTSFKYKYNENDNYGNSNKTIWRSDIYWSWSFAGNDNLSGNDSWRYSPGFLLYDLDKTGTFQRMRTNKNVPGVSSWINSSHGKYTDNGWTTFEVCVYHQIEPEPTKLNQT